MPIIDSISHNLHTKIVVWQLKESAEEFLSFLLLDRKKKSQFNKMPPKQGLDFLGVCACLKELSISNEIQRNEKGKPFLDNGQAISISHSHGMVGVAISDNLIGLDIELNRPAKIENIIPKFINAYEMSWLKKKTNKTDFLHIIWGIKESLYKLSGGIFWNFLHHYKVEEFNLGENKPILCSIVENETVYHYYAFYKKIEDYFLVWSIEKK